MGKIGEEWKGFTLSVSIYSLSVGEWFVVIVHFQGTVLLNANVAFLAIPATLGNGGQPGQGPNIHGRSAAEIASYASVLASIGCIILGLLLDRQNRTKERQTAYEAVRSIS